MPKQSLSFCDGSMDLSNLEDTGKSLVLWHLRSTVLLLIVRSVVMIFRFEAFGSSEVHKFRSVRALEH